MKFMPIFWWALAIVLALVYFASKKQQDAVRIVPSQVVLNASTPGQEIPFEFDICNNSRESLTLLAIPSSCSCVLASSDVVGKTVAPGGALKVTGKYKPRSVGKNRAEIIIDLRGEGVTYVGRFLITCNVGG